MYGAPALPEGFAALPHANPDAPRGGRIVFGEVGSFDSLNPYILRGRAPWGVQSLTVETLLGRNHDEPFALYGVLAESVETDAERSFVAFTLREEARFSDGSPVTVADVLWSIEALGTLGQPRYHTVWSKIATMEQTGPRSLRITFTEPDREMPLLLGLRPILQKAQFDGRAFDRSSLEPLIGSGPYVVDRLEAGRYITFRKNPDWWGRDLPFYAGQHNFEEIRYDYFADAGVAFEAFTAGHLTTWREGNVARWGHAYDFPAVTSGEVVRSEIPHSRPSGIDGLVFNTRREIFADWRVREALIHAFNFEFINRTLNDGALPRIASPFSNSDLGMGDGPPDARVRALLEPFADTLTPDALEAHALPVSDGSEGNRRNIRRAMALLEDAGWRVDGGVLRDADGTPFEFELLLQQGAAETQSIANIYAEALRRLGITLRTVTVDSAQFTQRTLAYDFDMTRRALSLSLSPGNEQWLYWGSQGVDTPGTRNWAGVNAPAAEAMIQTLLTARDEAEFTAAVQALDRVIATGRYWIPLWFSDVARIAHHRSLHFPDHLPLYGDWMGFQPEVWWHED
ncbi:ABC transporter substrate-binding protein [Rhodobaculum claviforme]|uniref:ABC transporter substrate-binding protein n=2 Tax=Rhodobaculum claviforme TaxID=1549854 RepID=A0A934TEW3_9RHOB|nr:ABC transporter substrate-binding protein [Rhodobaculum claviforme]